MFHVINFSKTQTNLVETKRAILLYYDDTLINISMGIVIASKRIWCGGIMVPLHGTDWGSIPCMHKLLFYLPFILVILFLFFDWLFH